MSLTQKDVSEIRMRLKNGEKGGDLAKEFGVSQSYISQIKTRKRGTRQVWLTVEEAKQLQEDFLDIVCEIVRLVGRYGLKYEKPDSLIILEGRIEQAESNE